MSLDFQAKRDNDRSMKLYLKATLITLIVGFAIAFLFLTWKEGTMSSTGADKLNMIEQMEANGLPNFTAQTLEGKNIQLSDFNGKIVIVSYWASWCSPCLEEFPSLIELIEKMNGDIQLFAISQDSARDEIEVFLRSFPRSKNPNIHVIWDKDRSLGKLYQVDRLPESFVGNRSHKLSRKIVGTIDWATPEAIEFMKALK